MTSITENLKTVRIRIERACRTCQRDPTEITLLLATKTQPSARILDAMADGNLLTGENRAQELIEKAPALAGHGIERHFIGHLQSNKAGKALDHVTCVQSIDRLSIAEKLNRLCDLRERTLDVFLQFNTSGESSKFGMDPAEAVSFARAVTALPNLRVYGLMTVGLLAPHVILSRASLALLSVLRDRIMAEGINGLELRHLSMGMSADLEIAIQEGSTMVRIGTDVFGKRDLPPGTFWPGNGWSHLT